MKTNKEIYSIQDQIKYKKRYKTIILLLTILISYVGGYYYLMIKVNVQHKTGLNFYKICLEVLFIYYISVFFHEIGHLTVLKLRGYDFRIFVVGILVIIKDRGCTKVKIIVSKLILGGVVIPNTNSIIIDEESYNKFIYDNKLILSGGIIFNLIMIIVGIGLFNFNLTIDRGFLLIIINTGVIISSFLPNNDISRIREINIEPNLTLRFLAEDLVINKHVNNFYMKKIICYINETLMNGNYNYLILDFIIPIIEYDLINQISLPKELVKFINWIVQNNKKISKKVIMKIRIIKIINKLNTYKLITCTDIKEKYIEATMQHPFHKIYLNIDSYNDKQELLKLIIQNQANINKRIRYNP